MAKEICEEDLKKKLTPLQYRVMREKGTEKPFSGELVHNKGKGHYVCGSCGTEVFSSEAKFDSGTGWPSFDQPAAKNSVKTKEDLSHGMSRIEVMCPKCGSHLGHVFQDGPTKTGMRYCINSCALKFKKDNNGSSTANPDDFERKKKKRKRPKRKE
jgi:peptide-methionine (R)-S-oxide reductase